MGAMAVILPAALRAVAMVREGLCSPASRAAS